MVFNNFEYVPEDYEENTESTSMAVESESVITEKLAKVDERVDINILRENNTDTDIDSSDIVSSSVFDLESGLNDENKYLVKNTTSNKFNQQLSACPILDFINSNIKCCRDHSEKQRPLAQLIGGRGSPKFECEHLYKNNANNRLRILGHWILHIAEIANEGKKKALLTCLASILPTFFDIKSFPVTANSPSLLFVKMVLRLKHVNLTNIVDQKFNFTSETALDLEKALGIATWNA
ncbi:21269_t:CDS:2 [Cetraspora pellucida]|uniref:21269_t:CDS:1 n=1 Tax=Cetraspora pellucida TaxID=1433469 RepID=A0A9N9ILY8_9GLOM|nr:21269_t:CDS:2 [Cetraspora pellucida]